MKKLLKSIKTALAWAIATTAVFVTINEIIGSKWFDLNLLAIFLGFLTSYFIVETFSLILRKREPVRESVKDLGYISVTKKEALKIWKSCKLKPGEYYYITDRKIFMRAMARGAFEVHAILWEGGFKFRRVIIAGEHYDIIEYGEEIGVQSIPATLMAIVTELDRKEIDASIKAYIEETSQEHKQKEEIQVLERIFTNRPSGQRKCSNCETINDRYAQSCIVCSETLIMK